jgi:acyl-[acyl-carrier-protein]-phospholipid O-acyltransferase/long-chain-fatty-acid--[acyl-carrier-protein] ligase
MGMQSCLYSPAKYGLIRDVEGEKGVAFGSGMFEMMAFLGILIGTVLAAYLSDHYAWWMLALVMVVLALVGFGLSKILGIEETQYIASPQQQNSNMQNIALEETQNIASLQRLSPIRFIIDSYRFASQCGLNKAIFGASLLWLLGGVLQMNVVLHCTRTLAMSNTASSVILAMAAVGIAIGCSVTGKMIEGKSKKSFVVGGLLGVACALIVVLIFKPAGWLLVLLIFVVAFCGGMFQVPCLAMVQGADIGRKLGAMMAYLNLLIFIFVLIGTAIFSVVTALTAQNSYVVFVAMLIITLLGLLVFLFDKK